MNETEQCVASLSEGASGAEVARASGIPQPTLARQIRANALTTENVLKIARAYGASIPDALIARGVATAEELSEMTIAGTLQDATDLQLLEEMARRLEERGQETFDDEPADESIAQVTHLHEHRGQTFQMVDIDDLEAVASKISKDRGEDDGYDA